MINSQPFEEQREYITAHQVELRAKIQAGESYTQVGTTHGLNPRVLKQMLVSVLVSTELHRCSACESANTRGAPHNTEHAKKERA